MAFGGMIPAKESMQAGEKMLKSDYSQIGCQNTVDGGKLRWKMRRNKRRK